MSASNKTWVNNNPPSVEDDDLNGFKNENNNLIVGSGQALSTADLQQTHKAVSTYAHGGNFYTDTGGVNAYVLSLVGAKVAPHEYFKGFKAVFYAGSTNTGAATANAGALGVKNIFNRGAALIGGEILSGQPFSITFDDVNDRFNLDVISASMLAEDSNTYVKGVDVASAAALPILSDGAYFDVTGTTTITSIAARRVGATIKLHFDGVLTLTHHATNLVLPGGFDIVTIAGAEAEFYEYAVGDWRLINYLPEVLAPTVLLTKIVDITNWDMDAFPSRTIPHGLTSTDIRTVFAAIRDDTGAEVSSLTRDGYSTVVGANISLTRITSGFFDSADYSASLSTRGWMTIQYVP